ncbi:MAG: PTS sugar transporter subunit IIA [Candidatus Latescibacterota bacterium]|nr:PTS sugar transporter subunit IIA [Candidatus Latescibacterota bacterium]
MPKSAVRILVALQNPASEGSLVRLAATLAQSPCGELHLTHVVTPHSNPPPDIEARLRRSAELALELNVGAVPHLVHGPSVTEAMQEAVRRWNCDMLLMGWYGDVDQATVLSSRNRDLTKALDVDTLIYKNKGKEQIGSILVPTGGGSHSLMGLGVANRLAQSWDSEMKVLRVARDPHCRAHDPLLERYRAQVAEDLRLQLRLLDIDAPYEVVSATEIVKPVIERSAGSDLLVLGASNDWRQEEYLAGSIPDEIAYKTDSSVLMVRSRTPSTYSLSNIFWEHTIRLDLHPQDKWDAIDQMVDILIEEKQIPSSQRDLVLAAARSREEKSPTSIGRETAIPHAPLPDLPGIIGALGICREGVNFNGRKDELVRYIFLLLTPQQNYRTYIPVLAQIASLMHTDENRNALLCCETPSDLTALIKKSEIASAG